MVDRGAARVTVALRSCRIPLIRSDMVAPSIRPFPFVGLKGALGLVASRTETANEGD